MAAACAHAVAGKATVLLDFSKCSKVCFVLDLVKQLKRSVAAVLNIPRFKMIGSSAENALKTARELSTWLEQTEYQESAEDFALKLASNLKKCFFMVQKKRKERKCGMLTMKFALLMILKKIGMHF